MYGTQFKICANSFQARHKEKAAFQETNRKL